MYYLLDTYDSIVAYFASSELASVLLWLKLISYGISFLLIFSSIILLSRSSAAWWVVERIDSFRKAKLPQRMEQKWKRINERLEKGDEANIKMAVIEADDMLDEVLKRMGLEGKGVGERLEHMTSQLLQSAAEVFEAHKLRDLIVQRSNIIVSQKEVQRAVGAYEQALKELEMI